MTSVVNWLKAQKRLPAGYTHCSYIASRVGFAILVFVAAVVSFGLGFA